MSQREEPHQLEDQQLEKYTMNINLNVLNHLGINLYSNIPSVLSEVVANAWDADAEEVEISINPKDNSITIIDNGFGMNLDDINDKFLNIGYSKRLDGCQTTPLHTRSVMGRKGIGKLSMFSIADVIEITTIKKITGVKNAFRLDAQKIKKFITEKNGSYHPEDIKVVDFNQKYGTKIVLKGLKKNISKATTEYLKKRISRRFSIIGEEFKFQVKINNEDVNITDRDYYHKVEYLWSFNTDDKYEKLCSKCEKKENFDNELVVTIDGKEEKYKVKGWLGLVNNSGLLQDGDDNLNKIVIMVRDKLAQEDILEEFREGGMYTKYLFGEIHADFLDLDTKDDIATSSRQKIIEDDPRYEALKFFILSKLKEISKKRAEFKSDNGTKDALKYPSINAWFNELKGDTKKKAKQLFGKIGQIATDDIHQKQLYKHGILAFESLRTREALDSLDKIDTNHLEDFMKIFSEFNDIEKTLFHEITSGRIKIIDKLKEEVDNNVLEKVLQEYLFEQLWLLDPSWDRINENKLLEQKVSTAFDAISSALTPEEASGRMDVKYVKTSGIHVIVELKRASVNTSSYQLKEQISKYMTGLKKQLKLVNKDHESIQGICVLGNEPKDFKGMDASDKQRRIEGARIEGISFVTYDQLIHDSYESYKAYLEVTSNQGKIIKLIKDIEDNL